MTSSEERMRWMPGCSSSLYMKGGEVKCAVTSRFDKNAAIPSGCDIDTVSGSSFALFSLPHSFSAAICMMIAGIETLTAVTAILSFSVRSLMLFIAGLFTLSHIGVSTMPATPLISLLDPLVRDQIVIIAGGPFVP